MATPPATSTSRPPTRFLALAVLAVLGVEVLAGLALGGLRGALTAVVLGVAVLAAMLAVLAAAIRTQDVVRARRAQPGAPRA